MDNSKYALLEKLLLEEAEELGSSPPLQVLEAQPDMLVATTLAMQEQDPKPSRFVLIAVAAVVVLGISLSLVWNSSRPNPLPFSYGENRVAGELSSLLEAPTNNALEISFDGGSHFSLSPKSEARVLQSDSDYVRIVLDKGSVVASVRGNGHTQWLVSAGPYEVKVIGTQFTVTWDGATGQLDVMVTKGEVLVKGRKLSKHGASVEAGNRVTVDGETDSFSVYPIDESTTSILTQSEDVSSDDLQHETGALPSAAASKSPKSRQDHRSKNNEKWKRLYKDRKYAAAVRAWKEESGNGYGSASAVELYNLANAARYAQNESVAKEALLTIRRKYTKSSQAEAAAFLLGKTALELSNNPQNAKHWFELYLRDYANGPMAEKSMGRLMQLYKKSGQSDKAQKMATQYMAKYPKGIFAKMAASMQSE